MSEDRTLVVGVASADADSPVLAAVAAEAAPGDTVRLIHAYLPPALTELYGPVLERAGDAARATASNLLARAARTLRQRRRDITVQAQVCEETLAGALEGAARDADLVIVSQARLHLTRSVGATLARTLTAPVLVVGAVPHDGAPVTVILHDTARTAPVLDAAFARAARRHSPLVVFCPWQPSPGAELVLAETAEQKALDSYLSAWQQRFPQVGVSVELRLGSALDVVRKHAAQAEVLVIGQARGHRDVLVDAVLLQRRALTLVVPVAPASAPVPHIVRFPPKRVRSAIRLV